MPLASHANGTGIYVQFNHVQDFVSIHLERVSLKAQNFKISFFYQPEVLVIIEMSYLTIMGNPQLCNGLILESATTCCHRNYAKMLMILKNIRFMRSIFSVGFSSCNSLSGHFKLKTRHIITRKNITIEEVPCNCLAALSVTCSTLTVNSSTFTNSCSQYNLANFDTADVIFLGSNHFNF